MLLARRAVPPRRGCWDVLGGFIEAGETAEQAVRREVREELGAGVVLDRLLAIIPGVYGPDRTPTLNIYYVGRLRGRPEDLRPNDDVAAAAWFPLTRLPRTIAFASNRRALRLLQDARGSYASPKRRGEPTA